jgi:hypothetical protein
MAGIVESLNVGPFPIVRSLQAQGQGVKQKMKEKQKNFSPHVALCGTFTVQAIPT